MSTPTWPCGSSIWSGRRSALKPMPGRCAAAAPRSTISNARPAARPRPAQLTGAAPEMGILEPSLIAEKRVVHIPETALAGRRLGGAGRRPGPGVAGANREVTEDELDRQSGQTFVQRGAEGTLEVGVLDQQRGDRGASTVVLRTGLGDRRRAEIAHAGQRERASKIRFAPGRSPG